MTYTIFGFNNPSGAFFQDLTTHPYLEAWGRKSPLHGQAKFVYCDLSAPLRNPVPRIKGIVISFAPIWLFATYLLKVSNEQPQALQELGGVIAISSSSYLTKQFAFSKYDKTLSRTLNQAHRILLEVCDTNGIKCQILAPTLVYGCISEFKDKNLSTIIRLMRILPILTLPKSAGLRQPIHAKQLALVAKKKADDMIKGSWNKREPDVLPLGGDSTMSYFEMLRRIQDALPSGHAGKSCILTQIPDKLFFLLSSPLLPINTKLFEAVMRINSDLSGFPKVHELISVAPKDFPILPLSI